MATNTPTLLRPINGVAVATWEAMGDADTGAALDLSRVQDKSVQIAGTFGSATLTLQVSNDGTNYFTATYENGTDIAVTAALLANIDQNARYFRPVTTGGTGTDLDITIIGFTPS